MERRNLRWEGSAKYMPSSTCDEEVCDEKRKRRVLPPNGNQHFFCQQSTNALVEPRVRCPQQKCVISGVNCSMSTAFREQVESPLVEQRKITNSKGA